MNIKYLKEKHNEILKGMADKCYSGHYISCFKQGILWFLREAEANDWRSYRDAWEFFRTTTNTLTYREVKHAVIGALEQFELYGKIPDSKWNPALKRNAYTKLNPKYKRLADYYIKSEVTRNVKTSTVETRLAYASNFLYAMQQIGHTEADSITEEAVMSVFVSPEGLRLKGNAYRLTVLAMLRVCENLQPETYRKVANFIPKLRVARKNIQYLTAQEVEKVRIALNDKNNGLSLCDRAIGALALYTGLRGCDIASLTLGSIDWNIDTITVKQNKTGVLLRLPLTAVIGNMIFDYIAEERPHVQSDALFICTKGAHRGVSAGNMWNISSRVMAASGIRQEKGDRKGLHVFRHHLATALLGNDISQAVISRTLGHSSPKSSEPYLSADFVNLKSCALDISKFPVAKGVFVYE